MSVLTVSASQTSRDAPASRDAPPRPPEHLLPYTPARVCPTLDGVTDDPESPQDCGIPSAGSLASSMSPVGVLKYPKHVQRGTHCAFPRHAFEWHPVPEMCHG